MKKSPLIILLFLPLILFCQKKQNEFAVYHKDKLIGSVTAVQISNGKNVTREMKTSTSSKILMMSIEVESEIVAVYEDSVMVKSISYRFANKGNENSQSSTIRTENQKYKVTVNGKSDHLTGKDIIYSVVDLYFREPLGLSQIYSNIHGKFLTLLHLGAHRYKMTLPDGKETYYTYFNNELISIEIEMAAGTVITKKI